MTERNRATIVALVLCQLASFAGAQEQPRPVELDFQRAVLIEFYGAIDPLREAYFNRKLEKARSQEVDLVIVEIDSPGGYVDSSLSLAETLSELDWAHTVAYVPREALSGAAIMALGADDIVMAADAVIGDAGPIFQGEDALFRHAPEKIRSNLVRQVRDLAERRDRPPAVAEAMVDMNLVVYRVRNQQTGVTTFMSEPEIASAENPEQWERGAPVQESRQGLFLEVNGKTAVELQLADDTANRREQLLTRYGVDRDELVIMETNWIDTSVMILNLGFVTGLLFVIGLIALYVEFSAPGIGIGGLIAGLCFALFFWSRFLGGTSGWLEVVLFALGVVFLFAEIYLIPGFGFAGISGILLLFCSMIMAGQDFVVPHSGWELRALTKSITVTGLSGIVFIVAAIALTRQLGALPLLNRLTLAQPEPMQARDISDQRNRVLDGVTLGDRGVAESTLRPAGRALFDGEPVDVVTDGSFVEKGTSVRVIKISGNRIVVRADVRAP